jgi:dephospho-CoA kinase
MSAERHLIVGLTGNLGSGKSTVAALLRELGARTVDLDAVVHGLLEGDDELKTAVRAAFGDQVFEGQRVDRAALARTVFAEPAALERLERLVYPRLGDATGRILQEPTQAPATFLEAIKVVEGPDGDRLDALWVLEAPDELLIRRVLATRAMREPDVRARLAVQSDAETKICRFGQRRPGRPVWRIPNQGSLEDLRARVEVAWRELLLEAGRSG